MTEPRGRTRLLVVDDDVGMAETLRDVLGASGYEVTVAFSGDEALERIKAAPTGPITREPPSRSTI